AAAGQSVGDCVDCNACVAVCPMGIDIRDGQQLECITCALCIDACDAVMDKIGKERGLIAYATLNDYNANMALATGGGGHAVDPGLVRGADGRLSPKVADFHLRKVFSLRTFIYMAAWSLVGAVLLYGLLTRERLQVNVLHDRNPQYVTLSDGSIRNGFTVKLLNMIPEPRTLVVGIDGLPGASMTAVGDKMEGTELSIEAEPDALKSVKIYVRQPRRLVKAGSVTFRFLVHDAAGTETASYTATFNAPETLK
ncbi:MAG TPA: FixG Ig-like domain-containing protein, partial [Mesorhizobium sp.]|nr:FixG Ig-like domain-containing protein [Mesorhizobium sp.]